jgi:hypothetical protein
MASKKVSGERTLRNGPAQWYSSVVPATWEEEVGGRRIEFEIQPRQKNEIQLEKQTKKQKRAGGMDPVVALS